MTPYEKAQQLLQAVVDEAEIAGIDLPAAQYAQVGDPVIACEVLTVACTNVDPNAETGPEQCNASQLGAFAIILARECSWTGNYDGTDNLEAIAEVSDAIGKDSDLLWATANNFKAYLVKRWNVTWTLTGGLGITTLAMVTGVD